MILITLAATLFAFIVCAYTATNPPLPKIPGGFKEYDCILGRDCPCHDDTKCVKVSSVNSLKDCKARCDADNGINICISFLWNEEEKWCSLKNSFCTRKNSTEMFDSSTVYCTHINANQQQKGVKGGVVWQLGSPDVHWAMQCDWNDEVIRKVKIPGEVCGRECRNAHGCTHFSWTQYEGGTCFLKRGEFSVDGARVNNDPLSMCGFLNCSNKSFIIFDFYNYYNPIFLFQ